MRFFAGQATEARLPFPISLCGSFSLFLFLTMDGILVSLLPGSASLPNNQKLMGTVSLSRKNK